MHNTTIRIRPAIAGDLAAVAAIYNEGIRGRTATFETTERTPEDLAGWLEVPMPFLVAERWDGRGGFDVVGWVHASPYRPRACYAGIGDFSVYVGSIARRQGIGHALMTAFVPACQAAGLWKLVSRIFPENVASLALCERHGFRVVGTYEKHGKLDGVWRDVVVVERMIPERVL